MLVDDSAVIRGALSKMMKGNDTINVVKSVPDGQKAIDAAEKIKPHVIILDIEMPVMDGLTALPKILAVSPQSKVIMFSSLTEKGAKHTMEAMRLGAVECLVKPSSSQSVGDGSPFQQQLFALIESLVPAQNRHAIDSKTPAAVKPTSLLTADFSLHDDSTSFKGQPKILAIGSSTGGPQALFNVLKHCSGFNVPIAITQHMPATFTKILAQHINQQTGLVAQEGETGMLAEAGKVYVAPGGFHMLFEIIDGALTIKLDDGEPVNYCKPAVDPMLDSLVKIYGSRVLCAILTGMGHDGRDAGKRLVAEKGRLIAQDEETSVVWGMPGAAAQAGICSQVLPLDEIGPWLKRAVIG